MAADLSPSIHAASAPHQPAVIEYPSGRRLSYGDLDDRSRRLAGLWRERGLRAGDHVAVLLDNQAAYFEVAWAAQRSGLYLTPVNWHLGPEEAGYVIADCGAQAVVSTAPLGSLLARLDGALGSLPPTRLLVGRGLDTAADANGEAAGAGASGARTADATGGTAGAGAGSTGDAVQLGGWEDYDAAVGAAPPIDPADEVEGAYMFYSSGTTGRPKGIMPPLTGAPFGSGGGLDQVVSALFGYRAGMIYLSPAPLYHAAPLAWSMAAHRIGGTVVVLDRFDAEATLQAIQLHRVTHAQFVPTHFVRLLKLDPEVRAAYDVGSLEMVVHAAAPCPPDVKDSMLDWLGPIVHEYYSASEGVGFCAIGPEEWRAHRGSVGRSLMGAAHIVGADGEELPPGEAGQVWFESWTTFEYHGDPAKTAEVQNDRGWATLGDIGYLDDEGYLYLTDRVAHTVISGGVNIYPREIEDVLVVHPGVLDVAVIGVPDPEMGERLLAVVQPAPCTEPGDALVAELQRHCRERLAGFKCPRDVAFVDELPRLPTGKIRKSELRALYGTWSGDVTAQADR
ncbi:MAG: acyl-CoA synthetase [Acidimicrobiales bacterium]